MDFHEVSIVEVMEKAAEAIDLIENSSSTRKKIKIRSAVSVAVSASAHQCAAQA